VYQSDSGKVYYGSHCVRGKKILVFVIKSSAFMKKMVWHNGFSDRDWSQSS